MDTDDAADFVNAPSLPRSGLRIAMPAGAEEPRRTSDVGHPAIVQLEMKLNLAQSALCRAAAQFDFYEQQHRSKSTPDGDAKAKVNAEMAAFCRAAAGESGNGHG